MYNNLGSKIKSKVKKLGNKIYDNRHKALLGLGIISALALGNKLGAFDPSDQIVQHMNPLSGPLDAEQITHDWNPLAANIFDPMPVMNSVQRKRN
jgi:hypothetical protein